ncbi:Or9e89 [Eciton burchellii]|nr:Or9e89 [Eciton burchellii]
MVTFEDHHINLNRILLLAIGLWPYEQSRFARFQFLFFSGILMEAIIFQLTVFVSSTFTSDLLIKVLSSACFFTIIEIKYVLFSIDINVIKELLAQFQYIHDGLKDEIEIAIAEKYSYNAKRYTVALTSKIFGMCITFIIAQFWTEIFDIVLQMNVSRSRIMPIMTEYFVDQEKYFYFILLWTNVTICIQLIVLLAIGTTFITFFQHIYGMFKIASYRIEHSLDMDTLKSNVEGINLVCRRIICAIDIQRQAMNLSIFLVTKLEIMMSCLIILGVTNLCLNLFRIISFGDNLDKTEIAPNFVCAITIILYMFIANYLGQELTDHNKEVFLAAYNIKWYTTPIRIQKIILFLLQRNVKDFTVNIGQLFVPSLEGFTILVKTSVSYFTVLHSTR